MRALKTPNPLERIRAKRLILEMTLNGPRVKGHSELCLELQEELEVMLIRHYPHVIHGPGWSEVKSDINHHVSIIRAQEIEFWGEMTMDPPEFIS